MEPPDVSAGSAGQCYLFRALFHAGVARFFRQPVSNFLSVQPGHAFIFIPAHEQIEERLNYG